MLKSGVRFLAGVVASLLLLLALLVTLLRYQGEAVDPYRQQILSRLVGHDFDITLGGLTLGWSSHGPTLAVQRLALPLVNLTVDSVKVQLNLWQSLRNQTLHLESLQLSGVDLTLDLNSKSETNPKRSQPSIALLRRMLLEQFRSFSLSDSYLRFNTPLGTITSLGIARLDWQNHGTQHLAAGQAYLPNGIGNSLLDLRIALHGQADKPQDLRGELYLAANELDLAPIFGTWEERNALNGQLDFSSWLTWKSGQLESALLRLGDNRLEWQDDKPHHWQLQGGTVQFQRDATGWQLASFGLIPILDGVAASERVVQLEARNGQLQGQLPSLELKRLNDIAPLLALFSQSAAQQLQATHPSGVIDQITLYQDAKTPLTLSARFQDLALKKSAQLPSFSGLNGSLLLNSEGGRAEITLAQSVVDTAGELPAPLAIDSLTGIVDWWRAADGWVLYIPEFRLDNSDLAADVSARVDLFERPFLALAGLVDLKQAGNAKKYYPLNAMQQSLVDYLSGALHAGEAKDAQILWYGALGDFPYANHEGIFQAAVPLRKATFEFGKGWQPLTQLDLDLLFENAALYMDSTSANLAGVKGEEIHADIPYLGLGAKLLIDARVKGDGEKISNYLIHSPLEDSVGSALKQLPISGPMRGQLHLDIPLSGEEEVQVAGTAFFDKSTVGVNALGIRLDEVQGELAFSERETSFTNLKAKLSGNPLSLNYRGEVTKRGYDVDLTMQGRWNPEREAQKLSLLEAFQGEGVWRGDLKLTLPNSAPFAFTAKLESNLNGLALRFPAPLNKLAAQKAPLKIAISGKKGIAEIDGSLTLGAKPEQQIRLTSTLDYAATTPTLQRTQLRIGAPLLTQKSTPIQISINQPELNLAAWISALNRYLPKASATPSQLPPWQLHAWIERGQLGSATFPQVDLSVDSEAIRVKSPKVAGSVLVNAEQPTLIDLERFYWNGSADDLKQSDFAAERTILNSLPRLNLHCADLRIDDKALGSLRAQLHPGQDRAQLKHFKLELAKSVITGEMEWRQTAQQMESELALEMKSPDLEQLLKALNYVSPIADSPTNLHLNLKWQDVPWRPQFATLSGSGQLLLKEGLIREADPKGAKLLSVLSLDNLMRRLRLDFHDVFDNGIYFSEAGGSFLIERGVLNNQDFYLNGAPGNLRGKGSIDLPRWALDYELSFSPNLSGTLPVVAAFAVAPLTGLTVFALSPLWEPVVDVITRVDFRVQGSMDKPKLVEMGRNRARIQLNESQSEALKAQPQPE